MRIALFAIAALAALSGCGSREGLRPAAGKSFPPRPATAASTPMVDELLTPPPEAELERSDELLRKSQERPEDRFNLPPPN